MVSVNYGINYKGSKNSITEEIVQYIINSHPDKKFFIDACCGGFAISHYVLRETQMQVYANDLNPYIMSLLEELFFNEGKSFNEIKDKWIPRTKYMDVQSNPHKYPKWFVGYALSTWSFGGGAEGYLYAVEKEAIKHNLFNAITKNVWTDDLLFIKEKIPPYLLDASANRQKRKALLLYCKQYFNSQIQLENLNRLERLLDMQEDVIQVKSRVHLSTDDYLHFINTLPKEILENAVIYIDPPYENTSDYYTNDIDYRVFWSFVSSLKDSVPVYVSSYAAPTQFPVVWSMAKTVLFNSGSAKNDIKVTRNQKVEKLFYNGYNQKTELFYDLLK